MCVRCIQHPCRPKDAEAAPSKADKGRACALLAGVDGHLVVVYKPGLVEKYTELGKRLWVIRAAQVCSCLYPHVWMLSRV